MSLWFAAATPMLTVNLMHSPARPTVAASTAFRDRRRHVAAGPGQHQKEFLAAPADGDIRLPDAWPAQVDQRNQHGVPAIVPPSVVHRLEVVAVDHQDGEGAGVSAPAAERLRQTIVSGPAVIGEGHRIGGCERNQPVLDQLLIGQVADHQDKAAGASVAIRQGGCDRVAPERAAVPAHAPAFDLGGAALAGTVEQQGANERPVLARREEHVDREVGRVRFLPAAGAIQGPVEALDAPIQSDRADRAVTYVLEGRVQPLLVFADAVFLLDGLGDVLDDCHQRHGVDLVDAERQRVRVPGTASCI